jgi:ATP:corrinoid adenosyltransferase
MTAAEKQVSALMHNLVAKPALPNKRNIVMSENRHQQRPVQQTVIITGRGCHRDLLEMADTMSELRPVKHAFDTGIKAQQGIDW